MKKTVRNVTKLLLPVCLSLSAVANGAHLPPLEPFSGKSESLMASENRLKTPAELTDLSATPNYRETVAYIHKLAGSSPYLRLTSIGETAQKRPIFMVVASHDGQRDAQGIIDNHKPTVLIQAGIHSGEIDGKDAGLMLLRDISQGKELALIQKVNLLFIPILSADGHERSSRFNRVNQRGPEYMGWRTNAKNLNLNRDYTKLDTEEINAVLKVINDYKPDLYVDIHVTDGEDYQYDVTYGYNQPFASDSPNIATWLKANFQPYVDAQLVKWGHKPGPLIFAMDKNDFAKGIAGWTATPRFSNGYGDLRHLPTVLVENHSLKPYKQRVLGTYVFIKATLEILAKEKEALRQAIKIDSNTRPKQQVLAYGYDNEAEHIEFLGIGYENYIDELTGQKEVRWTGKPVHYDKLPVFWQRIAKTTVDVPKGYIVPAQYKEVIASLKAHGIEMQEIDEKQAQKPRKVEQLSVSEFEFDTMPFEGRLRVNGKFSKSEAEINVPAGSYYVPTNQPLGRLAVALLQPQGSDSYFAWGFFNSIFQRTEYIENYAVLPLAREMLKDPKIKQQFEKKLKSDDTFAKDPSARLDFFYKRTPYYDNQYLKYPVLIAR